MCCRRTASAWHTNGQICHSSRRIPIPSRRKRERLVARGARAACSRMQPYAAVCSRRISGGRGVAPRQTDSDATGTRRHPRCDPMTGAPQGGRPTIHGRASYPAHPPTDAILQEPATPTVTMPVGAGGVGAVEALSPRRRGGGTAADRSAKRLRPPVRGATASS